MIKQIQLFFLIFVIAVFSSNNLYSQDIHYSQFLAAPYNLNPALTGAFDGDTRFTANQRTQWKSVSVPYQTIGGFVDFRNIGVKNFHPGISIYNDKAGDSRFGTLQLNLSGAYSKQLDANNRHELTAGIQTGITQRRINYTNLSFDNQYNGSHYDPSLSTGENFAKQGYLYFNLNTGLMWSFKINEKFKLRSGAAIFNINKPDQSFFNQEKINLDRRVTVFVNAEVVLNPRMNLQPSLMLMGQGKFREYLLGSSLKYTLENVQGKYTAIYAGSWFRLKDAGYILLGMEYDNVNVGISYDFNYSNLVPASNYRGGFEVSVIYILRKFVPDKTKYKVCPSFI
ncbi:MAG: PorP/SprF family type IX secretion system membrane protein [Bacteroidota bacterium]|nr:PorP/SprF family type IX secretion system membrane protein [Bacteroidota bacterium]